MENNEEFKEEFHPTMFTIEQEAHIKNALYSALEELKLYEEFGIRKQSTVSRKTFLWISLEQWKAYGAIGVVIGLLFGAFAFVSAKPSPDNVKSIVVETLDERKGERNKEIEKLIDLKAEPIKATLQNIEHTLQEIRTDVRSLNHNR